MTPTRKIVTATVATLAFVVLGFSLIQGVAALTTPSAPPDNGKLMHPSRLRLRVCVQPIDMPVDTTTATQRVSEALNDIRTHSLWTQSGYSRGGGPLVDGECSAEPYLLRQGVSLMDGKMTGAWEIPKVSEPSSYRLFVFVVSQERLGSVVKGSLNVRRAPQEALCDGTTCYTVTSAIYVTESELSNRAFLTSALKEGLELDPPKGKVPDRDNQR